MLYGNVRRIGVNLVHQYNLNVSSIWLIGDESVRQILQKTLILYAYIYNKNNFGKPHEKQKYGKYAVYFIRQIFFCVFFFITVLKYYHQHHCSLKFVIILALKI